MRSNRILLSFSLLCLVHCSHSAPRADRVPAQAEGFTARGRTGSAVDELLSQARLRSYRANLHVHHFIEYRPARNARPDAHLQAGAPCEGFVRFPQDDGRPCKEGRDGRNEVVVPPLTAGQPDPLDYFRMVCDAGINGGGLDIVYVTPHSKTGRESEADTRPESYRIRHAELEKLNRRWAGRGLCGMGQEVSSISAGNHMNVFGQFPIGRTPSGPIYFPVGQFDQFYAEIRRRSAAGEMLVVQLNHPDVRGDLAWGDLNRVKQDLSGQGRRRSRARKLLNDFGIDDFAPTACLLNARNKPECERENARELNMELLKRVFARIRSESADRIRLLEIASIPGATTNFTTRFRAVTARDSARGAEGDEDDDGDDDDVTEDERESARETRGLYAYLFYLQMGFRIAPTLNQDNHYLNIGSAHAGRTGVLATSLAENAVLSALEQRRTFATEDLNARAVLVARADGSVRWMGDEFETQQAQIDLTLAYDDADDGDRPVDVKLYYYRGADEIDFGPGASLRSVTRTVSLSGSSAVLPRREGDNGRLPDFIRSGESRGVALPLEAGYQYVFAEVVQADGDRIWTAPLFINRR